MKRSLFSRQNLLLLMVVIENEWKNLRFFLQCLLPIDGNGIVKPHDMIVKLYAKRIELNNPLIIFI